MARLGSFQQNLDAQVRRRIRGRYLVLNRWAKKLEREAKDTHPWQNQTGAAEQGLKGEVTAQTDGHRTRFVLKLSSYQPDWYKMTPSERIFHGYWLEVAMGKKYAVISPTIVRNLPAIRRDIRNAK